MSVRHIAAVLDSTLPPNMRMVAVVYADSTNKDDGLVWLSNESVAAGSGYSVRQVQEIGRELRALKILTRVKMEDVPPSAIERGVLRIPKNRRPNVYRFNIESLGVRQLHPIGVRDEAPRGAKSRTSGVRRAAPKPLREPERTAEQADSVNESQEKADPAMVRALVDGFKTTTTKERTR